MARGHCGGRDRRKVRLPCEFPDRRTIERVKIARELERRLERLVDGISATVFRGKMHPVDLANRLLRAIDLSVVDGPVGPQIDNDLRVGVHPSELDDDLDISRLNLELAVAVEDLAAQRGIRTGGKVRVGVEPDESVRVGSIRVDGSHHDAPVPPWAQLISPTGQNILEVSENRSVLGRGGDVDVVVGHGEVSRHHALIWRADGRSFIQDLASVNGTSVNGVQLGNKPAVIIPGDQLTLGPATFTFRIV